MSDPSTLHALAERVEAEMADPAEVAAGLTKAQACALTDAREVGDGVGRPTRWRCRNAGRVRKSLLLRGLAYEAVPMLSWRSQRRDLVLTPLGLATRATLLEMEARNGR